MLLTIFYCDGIFGCYNVPPDQWLQHDVPCLNEMSTCTTPSTVVCEKSLDRDAEIKCANMPLKCRLKA
jgi:hypothetical protein